MKVLAFVHYYLPHNRGGAEIMLHTLLRKLVESGHEVTVGSTRSPEDVYELDGVKVVGGAAAHTLLRNKNWDRVISHLAEVGRMRAWTKKHDVHFTQLIHSDHPWIRLKLAQGADLVVYNTDWLAKKMQPVHDGASLVVHPPVDPSAHATEPGEAITLVNLIPEKGTNTFYRMALTMKNYPFLGVCGGYEQHRQVIKERPNITIQGHTQDMRRDVWSKTKLLVMPSSYESFGLVALEAAASGIPSVVTDTPGLRECLGDAGTYLPNNSSPAWGRVVRKIINNPQLYERASRAALHRSCLMEQQTQKELDTWEHTLLSM